LKEKDTNLLSGEGLGKEGDGGWREEFVRLAFKVLRIPLGIEEKGGKLTLTFRSMFGR